MSSLHGTEIFMRSNESPAISIVIPAYNEAESISELVRSTDQAMSKHNERFEYVFVDDGSTDDTLRIMKAMQKKTARPITIVSLRKRSGKSTALSVGFEQARGSVIVTLDADLQDDPTEIMPLIRRLRDSKDLIVGWRKNRQDSTGKLHISYVFNWAVSSFFGLKLHDMNSGLKVMKAEVAREIPMYGELHRFIPVLAASRGFTVSEQPVRHARRKYGTSKFGIERSLAAFDLVTTLFLSGFRTRPLMIFGPVGLFLVVLGSVAITYLSILHFMGESIGTRPLLLFGVLFVLFGLQLLSTGLLGELISSFGARNLKPPVRSVLPYKPTSGRV